MVGGTKVVRFDILRAAWQVHGYKFSNLQKMKKIKGLNFNMLSLKSIRIMNRFAKKVKQFQEIYTKKMDAAKLERIKQKNVDMTFVVLLSLFDSIIENRREDDQTIPVVPIHKFYEKLVSLKVRKSPGALPNLSSFLTY